MKFFLQLSMITLDTIYNIEGNRTKPPGRKLQKMPDRKFIPHLFINFTYLTNMGMKLQNEF